MFGNLKNALEKASSLAQKLDGRPPSAGGSSSGTSAQQAPQAQAQAPPSAALTPITGQRKALLIGVNYFKTKAELRGCINDVCNVHQFLRSRGFQECKLLTDDAQDPQLQPTRANMVAGMQWLMRGAKEGDSLFLHFSGHGGQQKDTDGDEKDGYDETICPVDYQQAGVITDDDLFDLLVLPLPKGTRLTVIFDCCHSGSAIDLPFMYLGDGSEHAMPSKKFAQFFFEAGVQYLRGNRGQAMKSLIGGVRGLVQERVVNKEGGGGLGGALLGKMLGGGGGGGNDGTAASKEGGVAQIGEKHAPGDVFYFSGCRDEQTSADAVIAGNATGAMSYALLQTLNVKPQQTYKELLLNIREILQHKYSQVPQMSTSRHVDLTRTFEV